MTKRICTFLLALCLGLTAFGGQAASLNTQSYTDVPGMPTQDSVRLIQVLSGLFGQTQQTDEYAMGILEKIIRFVAYDGNRPVRYYDEVPQQEIERLIEADPDILHMSEYMTVLMTTEERGTPRGEDYVFDMLIDVDYEPGQLVVAVIGTSYQDEEALEWHPYLCEVPETGRIVFHIPKEDMAQYKDEPVLLNILTDRYGAYQAIWSEEEITERIVRPSKSEEDLRRVVRYVIEKGDPIPDDFRIFTVALTDEMNQQVERMRAFLAENPAVYDYFPADVQTEMRLLFPTGTAMKDLVTYEIVGVRDENYHDTYGDVLAQLQFAVQYSDEQHMVILLGFPSQEDGNTWEWTCMRASSKEGGIETIFEQLTLIRLEKEPGLLMVISEPIAQEETDGTNNSGRQDG